MYKAIIFDLNGTMINDMEYHTRAWSQIINNDLGGNVPWEDVKKEMYGKNEEVLVRVFGENHFSEAEMKNISFEKERRYQAAFKPHLKLIAGLDNFLVKAAERKIKMAIGSAAIPFNIDFVIDNLNIRHLFGAIVSADDVEKSKPDPETFLKAAVRLSVDPEACIVFEDAPKGVECAMNAGMQAIVLTTAHAKEEFEQYPNIIAFVEDYTDPFFETFFHLRPKPLQLV